jgi:ABC-type transport system involved in multi-copper enzyme maturation permease subunit
MRTTALTTPRQQTWTIGGSRPLLAVMAWELRRFRASRLFWIQAPVFFGLLLFVTWSQQMPNHFQNAQGAVTFNGFVAGTSVWGLLEGLPSGPLLLLGLLLPFVNADGVTRDLQLRTHELLLTTALPSRAYVWGRYLMGLLVSLGLALLLLVALLVMGGLLHLTVTDYPLPPLGPVLLLWVGMVLSATVLLSSVSFALGTLFPRVSTLVKMGILLVWFVGALILPTGLGDTASPPTWYSAWDPTSAATALGLLIPYRPDFGALERMATSTAQVQQALLSVENTLPTIGSWFGPHLLLAGVSLLLVLVAALTFQRFRTVFN